MNEGEKILRMPMGKVFCYECNTEYSTRQISYIPVMSLHVRYKAPFCPGCAKQISFERLTIDGAYKNEALKKSVELFRSSGKDALDFQMKFITIYYQGGVAGCSAVWPKSMRTEAKSDQFDSYVSRVFKLSHYTRTSVPKEFEHDVPFKFVYVEISDIISRTPIADFRLN